MAIKIDAQTMDLLADFVDNLLTAFDEKSISKDVAFAKIISIVDCAASGDKHFYEILKS